MKRLFSSVLLLSFSLVSVLGQRTLSTNETWTGTHVESDNVIVPGGITLTISAGTTVRFASGKSLKVTGTGILHAGNSDASGSAILFTADNGTSWGHIYCENTGVSWIKNSEIEKGSTTGLTTDYGSVYGGGVYAKTSSLTIEKCLVHNCSATWGGGIFIGASVSPVVNNTKLYSNTASSGGGGLYIWQSSASKITNCLIYSNNCSGATYGGGGVMLGYSAGAAKLINCVIANNTSAGNGKGIYFYACPNSRIINTIVWGNGTGTQIYFDALTPTSVMQYCGIQGVSYSTCVNLNSSNTAADGPNFNATDGSDWSIKFVSACLDKGLDHSSDSNVPLLDFAGNSRIGQTDIGSYECQNYIYTWKGTDATYPTYWNVGANWNAKTAPPNSTATVKIPSGLSNYPTGTSPDYTIGSGHDFTVETGARVTFNSLTNNGNLYLNSTSSGFASMIVSSYTRGSGGTEAIQLYLAGGGNEDDDNFKWHYISIPVSTLSVGTFAPGATLDLAQFVESRPALSLLQGWVAYDGYVYSTGNSNGPTFSNLSPGKGYDFWDSNDNTFTFSGIFNTSNVVVSLPYSGTPSLNGFNLLGNPFMSGLDWDAIVNGTYFTFPSNTSKGLYFTRDNVQCSYIGGVGIPGDVTGIIPPMQGFFTKTFSTGNSITLAAAARTHASIHAFYKGYTEVPLIRLQLTRNSSYLDETVIRFDESAKSTLDYDFDATKFDVSTTKNQIYSVSAGVEYAINGQPLPDPAIVTTIPLTINITTAGNYAIALNQFQALGNFEVGLVDKLAGDTIDIWKHSPYVFSLTAGNFNDRFSIVIGEDIWTGVEDPKAAKSQFSIYQFDNAINIIPRGDDWNGLKSIVEIIDFSGRMIGDYRNIDFTTSSVTSVPAPSSKGFYLVAIRSGVKRYVGRIIIK
jgi:parallel beta-helix repeat protein